MEIVQLVIAQNVRTDGITLDTVNRAEELIVRALPGGLALEWGMVLRLTPSDTGIGYLCMVELSDPDGNTMAHTGEQLRPIPKHKPLRAVVGSLDCGVLSQEGTYTLSVSVSAPGMPLQEAQTSFGVRLFRPAEAGH